MKFKRVILMSSLAILAIGTMLSSCSKNDTNPSVPSNPAPPTSTVFKISDFEVYDIQGDVSPTPEVIKVLYNVRNKTDKDYVMNGKNGLFDVHWKAKGSDGAWYSYDNDIPDVNAGASDEEYSIISAPTGIVLDNATIVYEIKIQD